jgi:hypothetical protein
MQAWIFKCQYLNFRNVSSPLDIARRAPPCHSSLIFFCGVNISASIARLIFQREHAATLSDEGSRKILGGICFDNFRIPQRLRVASRCCS